MVGAKDFLIGCLAIILCALLIPVLYLACKLSLLFAVILGVVVVAIVIVAVFGKIVLAILSLIFSKKQRT